MGPSVLWLFRNNSSVDWAIGFADDTCEHFADVGDEEEGAYEFGWQLWGRSREGGPQTLLLQDKEFLLLPKPKLEELRVEYDKSWEGTWEVHGKSIGVDPGAHLVVEVALVEPPPAEPVAGTTQTVAPPAPLTPLPQVPSATPAAPQGTRSASVRV